MSARVVIIMGPSGSGKTTVGRALAQALGWPFHEGDDFHPPENVARMKSGLPLTDADRRPWLGALAVIVESHLDAGKPAVIACSALKRAYRKALVPSKAAAQAVCFVYLRADPAILAERLASRQGHFFDPALLTSQLADFEEPAGKESAPCLTVDANAPPGEIVGRIRAALAL